MDIKKIDGTEQKRTMTGRYIVFNLDKVKLFLKDKYNIDFSDAQDDNDTDNDKEIISPLDKI